MVLSAICEPVPLPPAQALLVEAVRAPVRSEIGDRFVHFHDAVELVLFERASGLLHAEDESFAIGDGALVLVPSMSVHDFVLEKGVRAWTLLQMAPFVAGAAAGAAFAPLLNRPLCVALDPSAWRRAAVMFDWLGEAVAKESHPELVRALIRSIFGLMAEASPAPRSDRSPAGEGLARLKPALDRLHARPDCVLPVREAAQLCRMSPAYFSRRFKAATGQAFSDYAADYRLLLGAHRVLASDDPISLIAFAAGFANPSHFTARFRARFGMSPRAYRAARTGRQFG